MDEQRPRRPYHGADCDQDKIVAVDEPPPARDYCPGCGNYLPNAQVCYENLHPAGVDPSGTAELATLAAGDHRHRAPNPRR